MRFIFLFSIFITLNANSENIVTTSTVDYEKKLSISYQLISENLSKISVLEKRNLQSEDRYNRLLASIAETKHQAYENKTEINALSEKNMNSSSRDTSFEVWVGILLACIAILLTGLGIIIALLALWGLRNIKKAAIEESVSKSEILVKEAIEKDKFDSLIYAAVQKVIYRGVLSESDFPENNMQRENHELL